MGTLGKSWRIARRQPNTCCEQTCHRRATSDTRAPGTSVSATIRAFSSADQRRRRPGPVRTSTRRNPPFASSLTSNIRIARSPLPQPNQPLPGRPLNKGVGATLTVHLLCFIDDEHAKEPTNEQGAACPVRAQVQPVRPRRSDRGLAGLATHRLVSPPRSGGRVLCRYGSANAGAGSLFHPCAWPQTAERSKNSTVLTMK